MTPEDADRLERWVATLNARQLTALWRWITLAWSSRCRAELDAWFQRGVRPSWQEPE
jgi:hypothetical protein